MKRGRTDVIHSRLVQLLLLLASLSLVACGGKKDESSGGGDDKASAGDKTGETKSAGSDVKAKLEAKKIFEQRCTTCHGASGKGDGPGAAALDPKPRDYTDKEWQASVTDEDLKKVIVGGGQAVGKSPTMAPNPDLGKPDKAAVLDALVAKIRSFGK
jgi:mono/diheme cytochrome c family protein